MSDELRMETTPPFKLKDKPKRQYQAINLKKQFGFIPDVIIVEKVPGYHDMLIVRAVELPVKKH